MTSERSMINLGYWATLEHLHTWDHENDRNWLNAVQSNGSKIPDETGRRIAINYSVNRGFDGVAQEGYGRILSFVNAIEIGPGVSRRELVEQAATTIRTIKEQCGHKKVNPSAVTKWVWFRRPDGWFIYDRYAAMAVGAEGSSISGMRTYFGILEALDIDGLCHEIGSAIARSTRPDLRPERIVDKALWLIGGSRDGELNQARINTATITRDATPGAEDMAREVNSILTKNRFDLLDWASGTRSQFRPGR